MMPLRVSIPFTCIALILGCGPIDDEPSVLDTQDTGSFADPEQPQSFELTSSAFEDGATIPLRYECGVIIEGPGENITPPMEWAGGPSDSMSYAVTLIDLDSGVIHWVLYDIPASVHEIPENVPAGYQPNFPQGAKQSELQGSGYHGYLGPCSAFSVNTYQWTIHAIPTTNLQGVDRYSTEQELILAIDNAAMASASFSGES